MNIKYLDFIQIWMMEKQKLHVHLMMEQYLDLNHLDTGQCI